MGALIGLGVGVGLLLIWTSISSPDGAEGARRRTTGPVERRLVAAGMPEVAPSGFVALCGGLGLVTTLVVQAITATLPVAVAFGVIAAGLPFGILAGRTRRRRREFAEVWPEAIDHLASGVRAGLSLPDAVSGLAERGPEPLRSAFAAFELDYQVSGRFLDCLDRLKERLADPVGDRVVEALRVAREVGGGELGRLMRSLAGFLRDDLRTRSELESRQAWAVNGSRLAVAAPWLVLLAMSAQPEVIARYRSTTGVVVLAVAGAVCVVAYQVMVRIGRLPTEDRILS